MGESPRVQHHPGLGRGEERAGEQRAWGSLSVIPPLALMQLAERAARDLRLVIRRSSTGEVVVVVFRSGAPAMVFSPGDGRSLGELLLAAGKLDRPGLTSLLKLRQEGAVRSLESLLIERTRLQREDLQRFFDFQARVRLMDALAWSDGVFEMEPCPGSDETGFKVQLPALEALAARAEARSVALTALLPRLPAAPGDVLVRRRRRGPLPVQSLELAILREVSEPLLVSGLVARLLVDDDLVIEALLAMEERRAITLAPRAVLAWRAPEAGPSFHATVLAEVLRRCGRRERPSGATFGLALVAARPELAVSFLERLGGRSVSGDLVGCLAGRTCPVGGGLQLAALVVSPRALSRAALEGVGAHADALCLLRTGAEGEEQALEQLLQLLCGRPGVRPLIVGIDLAAGLRRWASFPDAVLGIGTGEGCEGPWLVERLVEALHAASAARTTPNG
jgi:hypothetical protein